jgi:hypothetical protein
MSAGRETVLAAVSRGFPEFFKVIGDLIGESSNKAIILQYK